MSDPFLAEIRPFGFNFAPTGWAFCNGQILPISQYTALFSLIGTYYGGNGTSNFALPNLQGSALLSQGQGPGLSQYYVGETTGSATETLQTTELPSHTHTFMGLSGSGAQERNDPVAGCHLARTLKQYDFTSLTTPTTTLAPMISATGGNQAHNNQQPYLAVNFCIALQGIYPPRS